MVFAGLDRMPRGSGQESGAHSPPRGDEQILAEFRALGPVEAVVGGRLVDLGTPKQRALLALLVSRVGEPVAVSVMLEELWSGHPPRSAMTSLQAYVANLRKVLEPGRAPRTPARVLCTRGQGYLLDSRVVEVDTDQFGRRAATGWQALDEGDARRALTEFEAGLGLWRGQAYADVADAGSVVPEVARLDELRLSVTEGRCAALLAVGAHEVAAAELEAFMQANPLREYGCELLSLALYRSGRQVDALAVLRANQKRLAEELGIDPRPALQHLELDILNQSPALDWHPAPAGTARLADAPRPALAPAGPALAPASEEVFAGRQSALRQLAEALAAAAEGRGRVVTVSGEPGIGKTTLLRRFAEMAGVPTLWGACPEHVAAPPFWPWEQVLRAVGTCCPHQPLPRQVAELLGGQPTDSAAQLRRFEAIADYLTSASAAGPLVVVLDHLHRADLGSLRLLAHLTDSVPASRLLVIAAYRPGEAAHLAETTAALARAGMPRIEITGLDIPATQTLASAMFDQHVDQPTAETLWARTEGNPFFLRELIKQLATGQNLDQPDTAPVPAPVREVELRRVAQLPQTAALVLSVAAIAGRHFDVDVVADVASVEIDKALEVLDTAAAAGLIAEDQQRLGGYRFTHILTAQALVETVGRLRRARLHRRIAAASARARTGR
jgi:DNA-binding SARP family transcriptional activator